MVGKNTRGDKIVKVKSESEVKNDRVTREVHKPWVKQEVVKTRISARDHGGGKGRDNWRSRENNEWHSSSQRRGTSKGMSRSKDTRRSSYNGGGRPKRFNKAAPLHSKFWIRKVENENREVLGEDAYSGIIQRYNLKQGWGFVLPDNPDELPQQVLQKLKEANKEAENIGKQVSDEHLLYFRKPDVNHADGFKLKTEVPVTFNVYVDDKGAGACDVTMAQT
mmetsp:Transcript_1372/g.2508  ORF Transcript_1372/g.2508 Transcript_1372/m.2508 type:complete len:221 (+) Transcript_1372:38-700(+)|eukprot:CAMPEP_0172720260 /NCGR_PEP_ID=MMETSP1074-20121228/76509_1 /TAXON_ID=2916 /ORGANISM="Ceratium fusus, Strain PA161109" /LENGTH=220 /DNA_ID=CAMNT_0013545745 /DNA_START=33 /DNA_END=695 /DNA_ORIENTATION=-